MRSQSITLHVPTDQYEQVLSHLLRRGGQEEAAFLFCRFHQMETGTELHFLEWMAIPPEGLASQSAYYLELSDEWRSRIIKRAHDLEACIVEMHSHRSDYSAAFSPSDFAGFAEFVPHAWWRLKGRPYAAVVVAETGFDALAWIADPRQPELLTAIRIGETTLTPTGLSIEGVADDAGSL